MKILNPILLPTRVGHSTIKVNDADDNLLLTISRRYEQFPDAQRQVIVALNNHAALLSALRELEAVVESVNVLCGPDAYARLTRAQGAARAAISAAE